MLLQHTPKENPEAPFVERIVPPHCALLNVTPEIADVVILGNPLNVVKESNWP